jgi:predicted 2-oxoglutarate/Fe(II)-dependent dioxygenase YbiX
MNAQRYQSQITTVDDVLSLAECKDLLELADSIGYADAPITTPFGFAMRPDIRNNTRVMLDSPERAQQLWDRVKGSVRYQSSDPVPVGLNERFRFYRYRPGQFFDWHRDGSYRRSLHEWSTLTVLVYLDSGCEGGCTELAGMKVQPRAGRALLFPHGVRHRGAPVAAGVKHVLRTDVMVRQRAVG